MLRYVSVSLFKTVRSGRLKAALFFMSFETSCLDFQILIGAQTKVDRIAWKVLKGTKTLSLHISDPVKFGGTLPADDNAPLL